MAANPTETQYKDAEMPEVSNTPFTGGDADWDKAPVGTYTLNATLAAIKKDVVAANRGISVAIDSTAIEDLSVKFKRRLNFSGQQVLDSNFKVTTGFSDTLYANLTNLGAASGNQIWLRKYEKDDATGLLKNVASNYSNSMTYSAGKRLVWDDSETGAKVIFQRTNDQKNNNAHTLNNSVQIEMPVDSSSADYQKVLEKLGIKAKPSTAGDIRVFAENKMITVFKGYNLFDYKKNLSGADRAKALQDIKAEWGVTPDDLYFGVDGNNDTKLFFTDDAAAKLKAKTKVDYFYHKMDYGGHGDMADLVFNMITGHNPGMSATYQRWANGIHASGASSQTDIGHGAGDFMFTKVGHNTSMKAGNDNTIGFNANAMLKRLDVYGSSHDAYGKKSTSEQPTHELMKGNPAEIMFKHTIPVSEWSHVTLSGHNRDKLIKRLQENGITAINGIPLENFILTSGMSLPQIDPSVYSASAPKV
jgi:hypothetical protein